tara:strand:+ start:1382 stop:1531 length:150 start_codon:yes stop_codon:yes gene_type:complete
MPWPSDPRNRPEEVIASAKANAKAALRKRKPKLTALELAFYKIFKKKRG